MKAVLLIMVAMTVVLVSGCRCPMRCERESSPLAQKVITVTIDANQNFLVNDKALTVEEFFAQAEFEEESDLVYLDVTPESAITEETVIRAIRYLQSHEYQVSMLKTSKYGHLNVNAICRE